MATKVRTETLYIVQTNTALGWTRVTNGSFGTEFEALVRLRAIKPGIAARIIKTTIASEVLYEIPE